MAKKSQIPLAARRAELQKIAFKVMARDGAWSLTTRALAREANIPHGTVHYAFSSKTEIFKAVMAEDLANSEEFFTVDSFPQRIPEDAIHITVEKLLRRPVDAYIQRCMDHPETELALHELTLMGARDEELRDIIETSNTGYRRAVTCYLDAIARHVDGQWHADTKVLAEQILSWVFGACIQWLIGRDDELFGQNVEEAIRGFAQRIRAIDHPLHSTCGNNMDGGSKSVLPHCQNSSTPDTPVRPQRSSG